MEENSEIGTLSIHSLFLWLRTNIVISFIFQYLKKFYVIRIIIHEYSHLIALRWMGYTGVIKSFNLDSVYPLEYAQMGVSELKMFYGAGAVGEMSYAMYSLLFTDETEDERLIDLMILIHAFIYGYTEAFMNRIWWSTGATLAFLGGWMFLGLCLMKKANNLNQ